MDQPKKPADISNLKARLGIKKPGAAPAAPGGIPGGATPNPYPGAASTQSTGSLPTTAARQSGPLPTAPGMQAPGMQAQPATRQAPRHDPYSSFRPPAGTTLDLGPDDGNPIENVRQKGGKGGLVVGAFLLVVGLGVGGGFGGAAIGRKAFNNANMAAKIIKAELDEMSKTISLIGDELKTSAQRSSAKGDTFAFDYKLVEALEQVDVSKRPTTTRIFRADYFRLENNLLDRLMNYYYDATALYREAEDHVRRTKNEKVALESFAQKTANAQKAANYGIVFDNAGSLMIGNLVEVGTPVCKGGVEGAECKAGDIEGFQIRANSSSSWAPRSAGAKIDPKNVIPIKPTELYDAVMTGSPDQVIMEKYKQRITTMRILETRLAQLQKELVEQVNKAASRPDLWSLF